MAAFLLAGIIKQGHPWRVPLFLLRFTICSQLYALFVVLLTIRFILCRSAVCHIGTPDNSIVPIWHNGTWRDKAGGYGIQEPFGMKAVKRIEGDFYNVMGLPIGRLCQMLKEFGIDL